MVVDSRNYLDGLLRYISVITLVFRSKVESILTRIHCNNYFNIQVMTKKEKKNKDTALFSSSIILTVSCGILCDLMHD